MNSRFHGVRQQGRCSKASVQVVLLVRDSRGTPYLKVRGRRLALADARLERRLERALATAFAEP